MATVFSLNFMFEQAEYICLVRAQQTDVGKAYKITIMNGDLERLLTGQNIIHERQIPWEAPSTALSRQEKLKLEIILTLQHHLLTQEALTNP